MITLLAERMANNVIMGSLAGEQVAAERLWK